MQRKRFFVEPEGIGWAVRTEDATVARVAARYQAVEAASKLASAAQLAIVIVKGRDGAIEEEIRFDPGEDTLDFTRGPLADD